VHDLPRQLNGRAGSCSRAARVTRLAETTTARAGEVAGAEQEEALNAPGDRRARRAPQPAEQGSGRRRHAAELARLNAEYEEFGFGSWSVNRRPKAEILEVPGRAITRSQGADTAVEELVVIADRWRRL
jgi:hypothetical protein